MIVVFVTWGTQDVPLYTKYYIEQLAKHADQVHVLTNEDRPVDESWFTDRNFQLLYCPNEGRDFEKYYYWMMEQGREKVTSYDSILLANDCLICYGPLTKWFKWAANQSEELLGLNSSAFPFEHIQGYLLLMRQPMLGKVWDHFYHTGVVSAISEVNEYELKLSGLAASCAPMYPQRNRRGWDELFYTPFQDGVPLVKHHCIMPRRRHMIERWQNIITKHAHVDSAGWSELPLMSDPSYTYRI